MKSLKAFAAALAVATVVVVSAPTAWATHRGESMQVSKTTGLSDGESVTVTFKGFRPQSQGGMEVKLAIAGEGKYTGAPTKLNYDEFATAPATQVAADGSGSFTVQVIADHGAAQDGSSLNCMQIQCWIALVQLPFGEKPEPYSATTPISFTGGFGSTPTSASTQPPTTPVPTSAVAETTTTSVTTTTVAATSTTGASTTSTTPASTTTSTTTTTVTPAASSDDSGSSSGGLWIAIAAVAVAAVGGGAYFVKKKAKQPLGE